MHPKDIDLHRELTSGCSYRMHLASHEGRVVAVKVFEGPHAKQDWTMNVALARNFLHSNVPKIIGVSDERLSESPFIVFRGTFEKRMNSLIAKALRTDLNRSVELSMNTVKGLAAGLGYIESRNILSKAVVSTLKWENFDIFAGYGDEPVISIHFPDIAHGYQGTGIEVLNGLCQKLFSEVNSILYDDSPERDLNTHDSESISRVIQINPENHSNVPSRPKEVRPLSKTSRREVWWKQDKRKRDRSLDSIARHFEDYLDRIPSPSSASPLRHIKASRPEWTSHRCPGYLREEITLTADVTKSAIVAYQYPGQREICSICGQLVQYPTKRRQRLDLPRLNILTRSTRSRVDSNHQTLQEEPISLHPAEESHLF